MLHLLLTPSVATHFPNKIHSIQNLMYEKVHMHMQMVWVAILLFCSGVPNLYGVSFVHPFILNIPSVFMSFIPQCHYQKQITQVMICADVTPSTKYGWSLSSQILSVSNPIPFDSPVSCKFCLKRKKLISLNKRFCQIKM